MATFLGIWYEITPRRNIEWCFRADSDFGDYDEEERLLRIRHINMRDELYRVGNLTTDFVYLVDMNDSKITYLQRRLVNCSPRNCAVGRKIRN